MLGLGESAFTITFGDRAENEHNMDKIGTEAPRGLSDARLRHASAELAQRGIASSIYDLKQLLPTVERTKAQDACVLVIPAGVQHLLGDDAERALYRELTSMPKDKTMLCPYSNAVVKSNARHSNTIGDYDQQPDIANGKGTVVNFADYPIVAGLRETFQATFALKNQLVAEVNHYYDTGKCGINFHGDKERKMVFAARSGGGSNGFPLLYSWFCHGEPVGSTGVLKLKRGDVYVMSEKAVGYDCSNAAILTLKHAAGKHLKRKLGAPAHMLMQPCVV